MSEIDDVPFATTAFIRDHCLCLHLQRSARGIARHFDDAFRPLGLTNGQFSLLMSLNCPEPTRMGAAADLLGIDRTTLTAALKPLATRKLVVSTPDAEDRRGKRLSLTAGGKRLLGQAMPIWKRAHRDLEGALTQNADTLRRDFREIERVTSAHVAT